MYEGVADLAHGEPNHIPPHGPCKVASVRRDPLVLVEPQREAYQQPAGKANVHLLCASFTRDSSRANMAHVKTVRARLWPWISSQRP